MRDAGEKQKRIEPLQPNGKRRGKDYKKRKENKRKIGEKSKDSTTTPMSDGDDDEAYRRGAQGR
jgi:hypothetical protein